MDDCFPRALGCAMWKCARVGKFTDCEIQCKDMTKKCHKAVLCSRAEYFAAAFDGSFEEASSSKITIEDENPEEIQCLLHFLYNGIYDLALEKTLSGRHPPPDPFLKLDRHVRMYALGDRFSVDELQSAARTAFVDVLEIYKFKRGSTVIMTSALIPHVYESTPVCDRALRNVICKFVAEHMATAATRQLLFEQEAFVDIVETTTGFAADLVKVLGSREGPL